MGIRIEKTLGYGLTDVCKKDPRINWDSPLLDPESSPVKDFNGFLSKFIKEQFGSLLFLKVQEPFFPNDYVKHVDNSLIITSLDGSWQRYGDTIDHIENELFESRETVIKEIPGGIYPYRNKYILKDTNKILDLPTTVVELILKTQDDDFVKSLNIGFNNSKDFKEGISLMVPREIVALAMWGEIFTDKNMWQDLKPLFLQRWT